MVTCSCSYLPLPFLLQLETDDKELRKVITISIKNQLGVRVGLFTPDMAFEDVVKDQIRKLVQPAMKCIDMVSTELGEVVQKCGEGVSYCTCILTSTDFGLSNFTIKIGLVKCLDL